MNISDIPRKDLDNQEFMRLRQATEKIGGVLNQRLKNHLGILRPLFSPRKLLGTYLKSAQTEEILGSDKAFAQLQEKFAAVCEKPFGLPRKLNTPLAPIPMQMDATPFKYDLKVSPDQEKPTSITSPVRWILSFGCEANLNRVKAMLTGEESKQPEIMKQSLIHHLVMGVFLERFPNLKVLIEDLRYRVTIEKLPDFGGLEVVLLHAPVEAFLPTNEFILQITQLSGIPAFQEIVDPLAIDDITDPLKDSLKDAVGG